MNTKILCASLLVGSLVMSKPATAAVRQTTTSIIPQPTSIPPATWSRPTWMSSGNVTLLNLRGGLFPLNPHGDFWKSLKRFCNNFSNVEQCMEFLQEANKVLAELRDRGQQQKENYKRAALGEANFLDEELNNIRSDLVCAKDAASAVIQYCKVK